MLDVGGRRMSFTLHGLGVSGGIAIGHAHLLTSASLEVDHYSIPEEFIAREVKRFDKAVKQVRAELETLEHNLHTTQRGDATGDMAAFVTVHRMILDDPTFSEAPKEIIKREACNAEWALRLQLDELLAHFAEVKDEYLRERKTDVRQVAERVVAALTGQGGAVPEKLRARAEDTILVARDLSPADVILFKDHQVAAFVTDLGGQTSHTAILARSLGIPAIVALHTARVGSALLQRARLRLGKAGSPQQSAETGSSSCRLLVRLRLLSTPPHDGCSYLRLHRS